VDREEERLGRDPGQEGRESESAYTSRALGVKRLCSTLH